MKIITKLKICVTLFLLVFVAVCTIMYYASWQKDAAKETHQLAEEIVHSVTALNNLAFEFAIYGGARITQQWQAQFRQISNLLHDTSTKGAHDDLRRLRTQLERARYYFDKLATLPANLAGEKNKQDNEVLAAVTSQFLASQHELMAAASHMAEKSMLFMHGYLDNSAKAIVASYAVLLGVISIIFYIFLKSVARPLIKVSEGIHCFGSGDLACRIDINSRDEFGEVAKLFNDMAEKRMKAEEELRIFRQFADQSSQGLGIGTLDKRVHYVNNALAKMLGGTSQDEFIDSPFPTYYPEDMQGRLENEVIPTVLEKGHWSGELALLPANGQTIPTQEDYSVILDENNQPLFLTAIISDITHRKQSEESLKQYAAKLSSANQELESFAYSVSHDLRTPLRAIEGFSKLLVNEHSKDLDEEGLRVLNVVITNVGRMANLIDSLLKFSRTDRQTLTHVDIDMQSLAEDAFNEILFTAKDKQAHLKTDSPPQAHGDRALLREVLANLFSNSFKYSKEREPVEIEFGGNSKNGRNTYYIRDNGIGFDMKYVDKIFGVFQRLHGPNEYEGTGIGLALVQRIINRHGGQVWAEGCQDEGTTIYFTLPTKVADYVLGQ